MRYLYIHKDWPHFRWDAGRLVPYLSAVRFQQGRLLGKMQDLGYQLKEEATLAALTEETVESSAIEGEELNPESVRSSLARRMGLEAAGTRPVDRNVEGIVEMMLDATHIFPVQSQRRSWKMLTRCCQSRPTYKNSTCWHTSFPKLHSLNRTRKDWS